MPRRWGVQESAENSGRFNLSQTTQFGARPAWTDPLEGVLNPDVYDPVLNPLYRDLIDLSDRTS